MDLNAVIVAAGEIVKRSSRQKERTEAMGKLAFEARQGGDEAEEAKKKLEFLEKHPVATDLSTPVDVLTKAMEVKRESDFTCPICLNEAKKIEHEGELTVEDGTDLGFDNDITPYKCVRDERHTFYVTNIY